MLQRVWDRLKKLITKELVLYVLFGVLTTLVSLLTFQLFHKVCGFHYAIANILSWIAAVTFAYGTNRTFVFHSTARKKKAVLREMGLFYGARLLSLGIEELGLYLLIDLLFLLPFTAKVIMSVVVIVANYVFSKLVVFRSREGNGK